MASPENKEVKLIEASMSINGFVNLSVDTFANPVLVIPKEN